MEHNFVTSKGIFLIVNGAARPVQDLDRVVAQAQIFNQ